MIDRIGGILVTTQIGGRQIKFFVQNPSDHIQHHHLCGIFYEQEELNLIAARLKPKSIFVDIGANVGNHTLYVAKMLDARLVIPFEVNPDAIAILRANLALNECQNVDTRFIGWGINDQDATLARGEMMENNLGGTRFSVTEQGAFPAIRGDAVLSGTPVDFIKMDIEGMELEALDGLRETIARWRPTIFAEIEMENFERFTAWMEQARYRQVEKFARYGGRVNYMVVPNEKP